jgi:hypothetical protein
MNIALFKKIIAANPVKVVPVGGGFSQLKILKYGRLKIDKN